jgi:hypothetical protein
MSQTLSLLIAEFFGSFNISECRFALNDQLSATSALQRSSKCITGQQIDRASTPFRANDVYVINNDRF